MGENGVEKDLSRKKQGREKRHQRRPLVLKAQRKTVPGAGEIRRN